MSDETSQAYLRQLQDAMDEMDSLPTDEQFELVSFFGLDSATEVRTAHILILEDAEQLTISIDKNGIGDEFAHELRGHVDSLVAKDEPSGDNRQ